MKKPKHTKSGRRLGKAAKQALAHARDEEFRVAARRMYASEGVVEIDNEAPVSHAPANPDRGAYVQAWVWVYDEEAAE